MKIAMVYVVLALLGGFAFADETAGEKTEAKAKNVKRAAKRAGHSVQEATCTKGDAKCAAQKAGNSVKEGAETVGDKAKEAGNKID